MGRYPPEAYQQLFPPGQGVRGRPLLLEENADHYRAEPHFFEWWYFDVAFPDGGWLVAIFHSALFNMGDHRPTLDLRYYPPGGPPTVAIGRFSRQAYRTDPSHFRIHIGDSWVIEKEGAYHLHLSQPPLEAELTFFPRLPGWRVGTGHLFADLSSGQFFDWVVPVPHARVKGWLRVDGTSRQVTGMGYHDHNWGNLYLPSAFQGWLWGRVWGNKWTVIFGDLVAPDGRGRVTPLLIGCHNQVWEMRQGFWLRDEGDGAPHLILEMAGGTGPTLSLSLARPMESVRFAALRPWLVPMRRWAEPLFYLSQPVPGLGRVAGALLGDGDYRRWPARGTLRIAGKSVTVQGVVERMAFSAEDRWWVHSLRD